MTDDAPQIAFRSHVGRDVLQNAAMFSSAPKAILEYVLNSLQYVDEGVRPVIYVRLDPSGGAIEIADNGRGMNRSDLENFFTMHAENADRKRGRAGRGMYGTGKSAGLGIGTRLEIDTTRAGRRNVVSISRADLEASDGDSIPLHHSTTDADATDKPNGTVVRITGVHRDRLAPKPVIELIERNLAFWQHVEPVVEVDGHRCEIRQPSVAFVRTTSPEGPLAETLGDLELSVSAAHAPLPDNQRGVFVLAGEGHLVAVESVGIEAKRFGNQLFGTVMCPALLVSAGDDPVEAVDASRSLRLNTEHPVARDLRLFIAQGLEAARREIEANYESERAKQSRKQLDAEAERIAALLNDDLKEVVDRIDQLKEVKARTGARSKGAPNDAGDGDAHVAGGNEKGILDPVDDLPDEGGQGDGGPGGAGGGPEAGRPDDQGSDKVQPAPSAPRKRRRSGGLSVDFREAGEDSYRSHYDELQSTIVVNLDHPQLKAALGTGDTNDPGFRRTAYEAAFTEYAQVIARAVSREEGFTDPNDLLYEIADALDRVARAAVPLYTQGA